MKKTFYKMLKKTVFFLIFFVGLGNLGKTRILYAADVSNTNVSVDANVSIDANVSVDVAYMADVADATTVGSTDALITINYVQAMESATVYSFTDDTSPTLGILESGQPAIIINSLENNWYEIYYEGQTGYIHGADVTAFYGASGNIKNVNLEDYKQQSQVVDALGDSIVYGDKLKHQEASFVNLLGRKINGATVNNYGWRGSALSGNNADRLLDRYLAMDKTADIIFVMGGTNDYGYGVELGTMGDKTDQTFYGGLNLLMCGLSQAFPESTLVFFTPLKRKGGDKPNSCGYLLSDYAKAVEDVGAFYGIQVVDLYDAAELDYTGRIKRYMPDGLHPNTRGHITMANYIYNILKKD